MDGRKLILGGGIPAGQRDVLNCGGGTESDAMSQSGRERGGGWGEWGSHIGMMTEAEHTTHSHAQHETDRQASLRIDDKVYQLLFLCGKACGLHGRV